MLHVAQERGLIVNAESVWERITAAMPTANPASNLTIINPVKKPRTALFTP